MGLLLLSVEHPAPNTRISTYRTTYSSLNAFLSFTIGTFAHGTQCFAEFSLVGIKSLMALHPASKTNFRKTPGHFTYAVSYLQKSSIIDKKVRGLQHPLLGTPLL